MRVRFEFGLDGGIGLSTVVPVKQVGESEGEWVCELGGLYSQWITHE